MPSQSRRRTAAEMREHFAAQKASGQSIKSYCQSAQLNSWTFSYWRRRFRELDAKNANKHFAKVKVIAKPPTTAPKSATFKLCFNDNVSLEVPAEFDQKALRLLVEVLKSC